MGKTIITTIIPFLLYIPFIYLIWWMINLKTTINKQYEQNIEMIELLKKIDKKI